MNWWGYIRCPMCGAEKNAPCVTLSDHTGDDPDYRLRGLQAGVERPMAHFYRGWRNFARPARNPATVVAPVQHIAGRVGHDADGNLTFTPEADGA